METIVCNKGLPYEKGTETRMPLAAHLARHGNKGLPYEKGTETAMTVADQQADNDVTRASPMRRGLKRKVAGVGVVLAVVTRASPMRRGLKPANPSVNSIPRQVTRASPMRRGLKHKWDIVPRLPMKL